ncbi:hypothetical protein Cs7R123_14210 [Catellatospora sp. TT07R-123]|uniref:hypothetical protein n=1 Tax=Catellatospora sp. TT07R-123 TaxID=2733863 RepID=UPI001B0FD8F3|nr:hypothetical protein [Catellatospora sp. TT07R-123]GHJ44079.1 hypothetical protein Cs7R123_14210 [Catellatospora sp. TT07R-123]
MRSLLAYGDTRLPFWQHVREYAVPPTMIETATARRAAGDWAGACAAARVDVDLDPRAAARAYGRRFATGLHDDLRHLAPDLLRWHLPRTAPDGLLRPGLTVSLARYHPAGPTRAVHLVVRTPPSWADSGQRISLALWDEHPAGRAADVHPHPHPDRRFRLDLHRHLWDARRAGELRQRSGADRPPGLDPPPPGPVPPDAGCAADRWAAEAALLLRADGHRGGPVTVRLHGRHRLRLDPSDGGTRLSALPPARRDDPASPLLPYAATWVPPDLELLRAGAVAAERLHPLVAAALAPDLPSTPDRTDDTAPGVRVVECGGVRHRIGVVDGVLVPLDHGPAELHREALLVALGGSPLPCLRAIDQAHRSPECLVDVRARLDHGDTDGALAAVETLLGPDVLLRGGALRDELEFAVQQQVTHGLYRSGLAGPGPVRAPNDGRRLTHRPRPRRATRR